MQQNLSHFNPSILNPPLASEYQGLLVSQFLLSTHRLAIRLCSRFIYFLQHFVLVQHLLCLPTYVIAPIFVARNTMRECSVSVRKSFTIIATTDFVCDGKHSSLLDDRPQSMSQRRTCSGEAPDQVCQSSYPRQNGLILLAVH